MESVDAKIIRAQEHLKAFTAEALAFLKSAVHRTVLKVDGQNAWLVYWIEDPIPPIRLSTIVGDCVFNMRSALDNLVCGLVRTKQPDGLCQNIKFPIFSLVDHWDKHWRSNLNGVPVDAQTIIKGLQPCFRPNGYTDKDPLLVLNKLSNIDKHRAILLTTVYDRNVRFVVHANDGAVHTVTIEGRIHAGQPATIPLRIHPSRLVPKVKVQTEGTGVIAFQEGGPWDERPVSDVLVSCLQYIEERVIARFKPFFSQRFD